MIEKSPDKTRSSFMFVKEFICMIAEMESKRIFIQDIHGKHLAVTSNFSVRNFHKLYFLGWVRKKIEF